MRDWIADHGGERDENSAICANEADGAPNQDALEAEL